MWRLRLSCVLWNLQISTHTSLRDVTLVLPMPANSGRFLLTHLYEMWPSFIGQFSAILHFYSHISTRCDWRQHGGRDVYGRFLLTHLYEMWHKHGWNFRVWIYFYSHISTRCDGIDCLGQPMLLHFYSHISTRCDTTGAQNGLNRSDFYSHISTRCDLSRSQLMSNLGIFLLTHLYEMWLLRLPQLTHCCWFLLTHLYEMWHLIWRCRRRAKIISTHTSLRDVTPAHPECFPRFQISTHTSLRDVTCTDWQRFPETDYFYSHISTRCDNICRA